jgi:transcriptional regulator with XRE-family HTH domain
LRRERGWTVKEFIEKLGEKISPAYMTKIEVHGEIPKPELICEMADVFECNADELLESAKQRKIKKYEESLKEKYSKAIAKANDGELPCGAIYKGCA